MAGEEISSHIIEGRCYEMETIYLNSENLNDWREKARSNVMVLGFFDGIHQGHCKVIHTALQIAQKKKVPLSLMSFSPHPRAILTKGSNQINYLMPLSKKEQILREMGIDIFYIVEFNNDFFTISPKQFVAQYLLNLRVIHAVAGYDFSYGVKGAGHIDGLKKDSGDVIEVTKVGEELLNGEKISSTHIRRALLAGHIEKANMLLGYPYEIECK